MASFTYFSLKELCASDVATQRKIDNFPSFTIAQHLAELTEKILEPLRIAWGSPIKVTSGYRCDALNRAVGGVSTSAHRLGYAADLQPTNGKIDEFGRFIKDWLVRNRIKFDQVLFETQGKTKWVHIGLYSSTGTQRCETKNLIVK
jgi:hypothetical protein